MALTVSMSVFERGVGEFGVREGYGSDEEEAPDHWEGGTYC